MSQTPHTHNHRNMFSVQNMFSMISILPYNLLKIKAYVYDNFPAQVLWNCMAQLHVHSSEFH